MFFITREVYKKLKNENKLREYIQDIHTRCNNYPMIEHDLNILLLEMELRDLVNDINESYYYDNLGLLEEIISRMVAMASLDVSNVIWENIPLYATAIYDMVILRGWNDNNSLIDLLYTIDINLNKVLLIEELGVSEMCLIAQWIDNSYKNMNRLDMSDKVVFNLDTGPIICREKRLDPVEFYKIAVERFDLRWQKG